MSDKIYSPLIQDPVTKQFYKRELNTHTGIVVRTQGGHCYINGSETTLTESLMRQRDQYKTELDTLIDDIAVLRANNKRLESENEKYRNRAENAMELAERTNCGVLRLEREVKQQDSVIEQFVHDLRYAEWEIIPHLKQENKKLKQRINEAEKLIERNIEALKIRQDIVSENYSLEKENSQLKQSLNRWIDNEREARELANKHMKQKCLVEKENTQLRQQIEHLKENYESNRKHNKNLIERNKELERKSAAYDKMMTGEMGELYKKAEAFDEIREIEVTSDITGYHENTQSYMYDVESVIEKFEERD